MIISVHGRIQSILSPSGAVAIIGEMLFGMKQSRLCNGERIFSMASSSSKRPREDMSMEETINFCAIDPDKPESDIDCSTRGISTGEKFGELE